MSKKKRMTFEELQRIRPNCHDATKATELIDSEAAQIIIDQCTTIVPEDFCNISDQQLEYTNNYLAAKLENVEWNKTHGVDPNYTAADYYKQYDIWGEKHEDE